MSYHRRYVRQKNRRKKRIKTILMITASIIVIALSVIAGFMIINRINANDIKKEVEIPDTAVHLETKKIEMIDKEPKTKQKSSSEETKTTQASENINNQEDKVRKKQSTKVLKDIGIDTEDYEFNQLVVVKSEGSKAKIYFFEKSHNIWKYTKKIKTVDGFVGKQGVSHNASEYAQYTPSGLYALSTAFGINDNPGTKMDYFKVTYDSYWVDDPSSTYYNQHVEGAENADWQSAEHLIDCNPAYNYAIFIEYNTNPIVPGKGSAFFVHVGNEPTAGCVAIGEDSMIHLLQWLNPAKSPHILII